MKKLKYISAALDKVVTIVSVTALILLASYIITWATTGKPSFFGYRVVHVVSASMEPTIMTGDFVLVETTDPKEVEVGDIVTYRTLTDSGKLTNYNVIHRVVAISEDGEYIFKGDNNDSEDPPVQAEQIGYKVIRIF